MISQQLIKTFNSSHSNYQNQYEYLDHIYTKDQPETMTRLQEFREVFDSFGARENKYM